MGSTDQRTEAAGKVIKLDSMAETRSGARCRAPWSASRGRFSASRALGLRATEGGQHHFSVPSFCSIRICARLPTCPHPHVVGRRREDHYRFPSEFGYGEAAVAVAQTQQTTYPSVSRSCLGHASPTGPRSITCPSVYGLRFRPGSSVTRHARQPDRARQDRRSGGSANQRSRRSWP